MWTPVHNYASLSPIQLPDNGLGEVAEDGPKYNTIKVCDDNV